jgi:hypothetical protein
MYREAVTVSVNAPPPPNPDSQASPDGSAPPNGAAPDDGTQAPPRSVEDVEAQWQHRVSQKDRAHAAAEQALRDENDALKRQMTALSQPRSPSSGQSGSSDDSETAVLRQQLEDQRKATDEERRLRMLETRRAKYPALSASVGEAGIDVFATQDEATLARLNAQLEDGSSVGTFAPTAPRRPAPVAGKALNDMSKAELEDQLRRSVERGDLKRS